MLEHLKSIISYSDIGMGKRKTFLCRSAKPCNQSRLPNQRKVRNKRGRTMGSRPYKTEAGQQLEARGIWPPRESIIGAVKMKSGDWSGQDCVQPLHVCLH